jgi:hypothetical protein
MCGSQVRVRPRIKPKTGTTYWVCFARGRQRSLDAKRRQGARNRLRTRYGLSPEEYDELLARHGDRCAICGVERGSRRLAVDHCHRTLRVRGLLCSNCNRGIGFFGDSPERLMAAARYLTTA